MVSEPLIQGLGPANTRLTLLTSPGQAESLQFDLIKQDEGSANVQTDQDRSL